MYSFPTSKGFVSSTINCSNDIIDNTNQIIPKYLYLKTTQTNGQYVDFKNIGTYYTNFAIKEGLDANRIFSIGGDTYDYINNTYIHDVYWSIGSRDRSNGNQTLSFCFDMPESEPYSILICDIFNNPIFEINSQNKTNGYENAFTITIHGPIASTFSEHMISYYKSFINE